MKVFDARRKRGNRRQIPVNAELKRKKFLASKSKKQFCMLPYYLDLGMGVFRHGVKISIFDRRTGRRPRKSLEVAASGNPMRMNSSDAIVLPRKIN